MYQTLLFLTTILAANLSFAEPLKIDGWTLTEADNGDRVAISRGQDSSHALIYRCYKSKENSCAFILRPELRCSHGKIYPAFFTNGHMTRTLNVICSAPSEQHYLVIKDFRTMQQLLHNSNAIGIAIPMAEGNFRIMRFPVKGAGDVFTQVEN